MYLPLKGRNLDLHNNVKSQKKENHVIYVSTGEI